ncbi:MAG TPA: ATP-grasp domain-containing protein [Gemmatimonadales bacterium]|jgi:phenylacetate-CoA ligase|nr:ATP-grasp domain-containing protein [Gemmatimonadales bacterium]
MSSLLLKLYHQLPSPARAAAATLRGLYLRAWRYGAGSDRLVDEALAREHWTAAQWQSWREERLAFVLHRAATRVPYYRAHWEERRRRGDTASWELLEHWPILEKDALRAQPEAFVADDCNISRMFAEQTSGTTGKPLRLWRRRDTVQGLYAIATARTRRWYGVTPDDRWARLGGQLVTPVAQQRPPFWVWNAALHQLYMSTYHLAPALVPHYLDALKEYGIASLSGYTSSLYALAQEILRVGRTDLRMKVVITNAEPVTPQQRETIARAFQCPVQETYGMAEAAVAASQCPAGRLHQWPEVGILEVCDGDHAAPLGAFGEFIATGLLNADMPLIRYRTGDCGRLPAEDTPCSCGRTLPAIESVDGRTNDLLITRDGRKVFWLNPVFYGLPVRQGQIVQETLERIRVRYAPAAEFSPAVGQEIIKRLRERMGDVEVVLEQVVELPRGANGKLRAVLCNLSPADLATALGGNGAAPAPPAPPSVAVRRRSRRVLVLDGHRNQALACVRSLGRAGHTVFVASHFSWPLAGWSRHSQKRFHLAGETLAAFAALRAWAHRNGIDMVLPVTERSCLLCNAERGAWEALGITVGCGPNEMLALAFDKEQTIRRAMACRVNVPLTAFPTSLDEARAAAEEMGYPCIVKPRFSNAWDGGSFATDLGTAYVARPEDLADAVASRIQGDHWPLLQQYVPGQGKGIFTLCDHGRVVAWSAHERLRDVRPSGSGSSMRRSAPIAPALREAAERLLADFKWHGPAMLEFRDDGVHAPWLMEVNGRFWGSLQVSIAAGIDFPALWVQALGGEPVQEPTEYRLGVTLRWLWGDFKRLLHVLRGPPRGFPGRYPTRWEGLKEFFGRQPPETQLEVWDRRDPWPLVAEWLQGARELLGVG